MSDRDRRLWLDGYLEQIFVRDTALLGEQRDPRRLRQFLGALAANTAGLVADTELARAADIDVRTAKRYQRLLEDLGIVDAVPAWFTNRLARLAKSHKRYVADTGLAAALVGLDVTGLLRHGDLMGRLLDTFVAAQFRPLLTPAANGARLHHLRQRDGHHEVDLLLEYPDGRVVAMEVKASAGPRDSDARHLAWLRERMAQRFVAGIVWHTGHWVYPLGDRITAVPIAVLWGSQPCDTRRFVSHDAA
ncbi:MAG: ATP-binding protein [Pseudonocardiaceae bacterium]